MTLPNCLIIDLDGTLCDHSHRLKFIVDPWEEKKKLNILRPDEFKKWKPDYDSFHAALSEDKCNEWCKELIERFYQECYEHLGREIIFITGRPERYRKQTQIWIDRKIIGENQLFMRPDFLPKCDLCKSYQDGPATFDSLINCNACKNDFFTRKPDHRPAHEVKKEIYEREILGKYEVLFVLEDSDRCCQMYKELGLTVLQVK
jgi:hypothetical protein